MPFRLLHLMFVLLCGWLTLLSGATASKDVELLVLATRSPWSAAPQRRPRVEWGWPGSPPALIRLPPTRRGRTA
jgi:hypothetical protein